MPRLGIPTCIKQSVNPKRCQPCSSSRLPSRFEVRIGLSPFAAQDCRDRLEFVRTQNVIRVFDEKSQAVRTRGFLTGRSVMLVLILIPSLAHPGQEAVAQKPLGAGMFSIVAWWIVVPTG